MPIIYKFGGAIMDTFTIEEVIVLLIILGIFISLAICLIKGLFKVALSIFIVAVLFGFGFGWLPGQLEAIKNGEKTKEQVINETFTTETLNTSLNTSQEYYEKNKDNLFTTIESAFTKLGNIVFPNDTQEPDSGIETINNQ